MPHHQTACALRLSALGDVVLTTGVLDYWHRTRGLSFIFLTRPGPAEVLVGHPAIERVVVLDGPELSGAAWLRRGAELAREFSGLPLIDLHGTLRSRLLALRWRGPVRRYPKLGLERRAYDRFRLDAVRQRLERTCVTQRYALALEAEPPSPAELLPVIALAPEETAQATARLLAIQEGASRQEAARQGAASAGAGVVALHPYATHPNKAWPREHWAALASALSQAGVRWFVVGRGEAPLLPGDPRDLTGRTSLRETCALLRAADALVTGDSGPMHLAAGVGTPVVALFGPTHRAWGFAPQGPADVVLERAMDCRPCSLHGARPCPGEHACLAAITPGEVLEALLQTLERA
ncbi:MAG: glycosyltransferase family 9 protein [Desulfovibrionaceae bacterium]